jgi:hypothetical protein
MGSCASVVRKKQSIIPNSDKSANVPYAPYTSKNQNKQNIKTSIELNKMSHYNTNPIYNGTPRYV